MVLCSHESSGHFFFFLPPPLPTLPCNKRREAHDRFTLLSVHSKGCRRLGSSSSTTTDAAAFFSTNDVYLLSTWEGIEEYCGRRQSSDSTIKRDGEGKTSFPRSSGKGYGKGLGPGNRSDATQFPDSSQHLLSPAQHYVLAVVDKVDFVPASKPRGEGGEHAVSAREKQVVFKVVDHQDTLRNHIFNRNKTNSCFGVHLANATTCLREARGLSRICGEIMHAPLLQTLLKGGGGGIF